MKYFFDYLGGVHKVNQKKDLSTNCTNFTKKELV